MKTISLIITMLLALNVFTQNSNQYERYENHQRYLIADNVNIRSSPSTSGKVIANLPIASKIIIKEVSEITLTIKGYTTNWLKIEFFQNKQRKEGYVWGGLVATEMKTDPQDESIKILYGIESYNASEYDIQIQVRIAKNNQQLAKATGEAVGSLGTYNSLQVTDGKGISAIDNIITVNMSDDMCAGAFGDIVMYWHDNKLSYITTLRDGSDAPCFADEEYIYPEDENGEPGIIIWTNQSGCYEDDDYETPSLDVDEQKKFIWNGKQLVETK